MSTQFISSNNGTNKSSNLINLPKSLPCLASKRPFKATTYTDSTTLIHPVVPSGIRTNNEYVKDKPYKRFKPNLNSSRSRISFDGSEEAFGYTKSKTFALPSKSPLWNTGEQIQHNIGLQSSTESAAPTRESSTTSKEGTGENIEPENEEEGGFPLLGAKENTIKASLFAGPASANQENDECCAKKERSLSTSTMTSPTLSSSDATGLNLARDLSLGRTGSIDTADTCEAASHNLRKHSTFASSEATNETAVKAQEMINSKIQRKFNSKVDKSKARNEEDLIALAKERATEQGFTCLSTLCPSKSTSLTFQCKNNHKFSQKGFFEAEKIVCPKCERYLNRCREYAKSNNGRF